MAFSQLLAQRWARAVPPALVSLSNHFDNLWNTCSFFQKSQKQLTCTRLQGRPSAQQSPRSCLISSTPIPNMRESIKASQVGGRSQTPVHEHTHTCVQACVRISLLCQDNYTGKSLFLSSVNCQGLLVPLGLSVIISNIAWSDVICDSFHHGTLFG